MTPPSDRFVQCSVWKAKTLHVGTTSSSGYLRLPNREITMLSLVGVATHTHIHAYIQVCCVAYSAEEYGAYIVYVTDLSTM